MAGAESGPSRGACILSWLSLQAQWGGEFCVCDEEVGGSRSPGPSNLRGAASTNRPLAVAMQQAAPLCSSVQQLTKPIGRAVWGCSSSSLCFPLSLHPLLARCNLSLQNASSLPTGQEVVPTNKGSASAPGGPVKALFCWFPGGRDFLVSLLVSLVCPVGLGLGTICRGKCFSWLWQVSGQDSQPEVTEMEYSSAAGLTRPRAACLFVSKPHVCLTCSHQHARVALARGGGEDPHGPN